jgi:hypothetical protein
LWKRILKERKLLKWYRDTIVYVTILLQTIPLNGTDITKNMIITQKKINYHRRCSIKLLLKLRKSSNENAGDKDRDL